MAGRRFHLSVRVRMRLVCFWSGTILDVDVASNMWIYDGQTTMIGGHFGLQRGSHFEGQTIIASARQPFGVFDVQFISWRARRG